MEIQKVQQQNLSEIKNLQDAIMMLSDQPHLHAFGERKLNPLKTFENRYTWTTIRTILEEAQVVGSALVHLQQENEINSDDFKIAIVYIEDDLETVELDHFLSEVDVQFLFGTTLEVNKILKTDKMKPFKAFTFDYENSTEQIDEQVENFEMLKEIGQQNRSAWQDPKNDSIYGIFFDVKKQFQVVHKTQQQLLHDILQTQKKLQIEQNKQIQGTYISLNGSANYYEHVFRFYNLLHLHNRIALPSVYKNYLTDLYFAQPTIVMANFDANYAKIHKDHQNLEVDFQKQKKNLVKQKDGLVKSLLKGLFFQQPLDQIKYRSVKNVVSINEASYHHVNSLLEESVDVSAATFTKALNFLEHDGLYTAQDIGFNDCEALKMCAKDNKGFLVLENGNKKNATLNVGCVKKDQVYLEGTVDDFVKLGENKYMNARGIESFYRNNNPYIQDIFVDVNEKTNTLVGIVDINNMVKVLDIQKDQNENKNMKENTLKLLQENLEKGDLDNDAKISKIHVEQQGFREKNLLDKFGHKKQARFTSLYSKELFELKSDNQ